MIVLEKSIKKILCILVIFFSVLTTQAQQSYSRQGNTFTQVSSRSSRSTSQKTSYTWKANDGKTYDIYISSTGRCFIKKVSQRTSNEYNSYLPEDVSKEIAKELGITYQPPRRRQSN